MILPNENIVENEDDENDSNIENYGLLKLKKNNYKKYRDDILQTGNYQSLQENRTKKIIVPIHDRTDDESDYTDNY